MDIFSSSKKTCNNVFCLPEFLTKQIDIWLKKFPPDQKRSAVIPALRICQDYNGGFLNMAYIESVALYLKLPKISVYEVATFYSMFELNPVGRNKICVCTNVSCMINGSNKILEHLKKRLGVNINEVTPDGKYMYKQVECLAACGGAPVIYLNNMYYENLDIEKLDKILDSLE